MGGAGDPIRGNFTGLSLQAVRAYLKSCAAYQARTTSPKFTVGPAERAGAALPRAYEGLEQLVLTIRRAVREVKRQADDAEARGAYDPRVRQVLLDAAEDLEEWR